ncbi:hypothetical protein U1Q18_025947, partial [Sarracenia purpurea var. burkii]
MDTSKEVNFKITAIELVIPLEESQEASPTEPNAAALSLCCRALVAIRRRSGHRWRRQLPEVVRYFAVATGGGF